MSELPSEPKSPPSHAEEDVHRYVVVDSGPIIRLTATSSLWKKAKQFCTVPAVLQEIRDEKARQHLESLPFELNTREPSPEGIQAVIDFSRQTGDYQSLSSVDLQVLGLLYDLEREGCGDMSHVRTRPKRTVGLGKLEVLGNEDGEKRSGPRRERLAEKTKQEESNPQELQEKPYQTLIQQPAADCASKPESWAALFNSSSCPSDQRENIEQLVSARPKLADEPLHVSFGQMKLTSKTQTNDRASGQFSDADEDESAEDDERSSETENEISDEDCDVYILDPEEVDTKSQVRSSSVQQELESEFPSLAAASTVGYKESDKIGHIFEEGKLSEKVTDEEQRKRESLRPISKSGKLHNLFRNYGHLMKSEPATKITGSKLYEQDAARTAKNHKPVPATHEKVKSQSRIIGGSTLAGQEIDVEDDGEGWITSAKEISTLKATGSLDPMRKPNLEGRSAPAGKLGPPASRRAACATTDFAMQNVILQMNMELLSVDGIKVRKLKSWVTRCGACFKVYTNTDEPGPLKKRLFCERCGSDMMQRIAASVDAKTGRLRLHLSKKYKHNLRGTKFSLPKPGTGNRFQGDLLLREDQLLMGAWNQKVKMRSGGKAKNAAQSMFGRDIASNVGCHASAITADDVRVGFGKRNPNAAKGRERRGKKKKSSDKACGLRRY